MAKTVADLLIDRLIGWGVETIFSLPGDGINGIYESLRTRQDRIKLIQVRHEEAAAFAACGYAKYTGRLAKAAAAGERVIDLLERVPDVRDREGARRAPPFVGRVELQNVSFAYEPGQPVLEGLSLVIEPGQHVALVGPSGSGKSTLAGLVLRLYEPQHGQVLIDTEDIRQFTLGSLRSQISVVLQDNLLFAGTVRENIGCAAPGAAMEDIAAAARLGNAHEFIIALPQGYETVVGERGVTLSHGQRQRIALARAAVRCAPVLILDEPMTGLDKRSQRAVLDALEKVYRNRTTLFITHDLRHAARADVILYLEEGRIVERGTHAGLLQARGRYASLYRLQNISPGRDGSELLAAEAAP